MADAEAMANGGHSRHGNHTRVIPEPGARTGVTPVTLSPLTCYDNGCDHDECRAAHTELKRRRWREQHRPDAVPNPATVPAGTVRTHLAELREAGLGVGFIARRAGVAEPHVWRIISGEVRKVTPATRDRLMGVMANELAPGALVPSEETLAQVERLVGLGFTLPAIAKAAGLPRSTLRSIDRGRPCITFRTASAIARVYEDEFPNGDDLDSADPLAEWRLLLDEIGDQSWRADAECRRLEGDVRNRVNLFFPGRGDDVDAPRAVCARCPVAAPCLEYAVRTRTLIGIWGGTSGDDRRAIRHEQVVAARTRAS